jgi:hypothetical protein
MKHHTAILVAVMLLLAGCVGGQGGLTSTNDGDATTAETTTAGTTGDDADSTESASTMNFYVSDEENAMGDFAHLNVTISKVGLKRAGDDANWTTYDVDNRTVDLTRLKGANATRLDTFAVENGSYETVFVHVSEVNGTLTNGESVNVKLPSEKLQLHQSFTVGANQSVDYVFDISVFKAGQSGKYVLKPVIGESGTDQEIEDVDEQETADADDSEREDGDNEREDEDDENETAEEDREDDDRDAENETDSDDAGTLNATFVGNVTPGENATVSVTRDGSAVANATVEVEGEVVGQTNADGTLTFSVPDREDLEVEIETDDESVTLEKQFGKDEGNGENGNGDGN